VPDGGQCGGSDVVFPQAWLVEIKAWPWPQAQAHQVPGHCVKNSETMAAL
jgi:hypothetical protein